MKLPGVLRGKVDNSLLEIRATLPQWCGDCRRYVKHDEEHDDSCTVQIEPAAHKARARARGDLSFKGYLLLYGIFICLLAAAYLIWKAELI